MRRIAILCLLLTLGGCGYKTWWNASFSGGNNPNRPNTASENMQRVLGQDVAIEPMTTEPGDIWPGPLPPAPTLKDLEANGGMPSQAQTPGSPRSRGALAAPFPAPNPSIGSSTPPNQGQPAPVAPEVAPPLSSYRSPIAPPGQQVPGGSVLTTPSGPAVTTGGGPGYQTTINPGGGQSIVVPNGNGTSTVIRSDGRIETIPTPK